MIQFRILAILLAWPSVTLCLVMIKSNQIKSNYGLMSLMICSRRSGGAASRLLFSLVRCAGNGPPFRGTAIPEVRHSGRQPFGDEPIHVRESRGPRVPGSTSLSIPFHCWVAAEKKAARVEVSISLAFLYWVPIALHPWSFISDVATFVLKNEC